jgi:hypothetical protein
LFDSSFRTQSAQSARILLLEENGLVTVLVTLILQRVCMRASLPSMIRDWRAAMLLVAAACLTPDRASAGCGDHVTILNGSAASEHHATAPADPSQPMKFPCQGPNCSGKPVPHPASPAPVPPTTPQGKEIAQTLEGLSGDGALPFRFDRDSVSADPIRRASSVFHPPRIG